jgi:hypothetical protein
MTPARRPRPHERGVRPSTVLAVVLLSLALLVPADAATKLRKPSGHRGFQTRVGRYTIGPGKDVEVCEYRRLANRKPMDVSRFTLRMPPGAHHFALWTYGGSVTDDAKFPRGPVESVGCLGVAPDESSCRSSSSRRPRRTPPSSSPTASRSAWMRTSRCS